MNTTTYIHCSDQTVRSNTVAGLLPVHARAGLRLRAAAELRVLAGAAERLLLQRLRPDAAAADAGSGAGRKVLVRQTRA